MTTDELINAQITPISKEGRPDLDLVRTTVMTKPAQIFDWGLKAAEGRRVWSPSRRRWVFVRRAMAGGQIVKHMTDNLLLITVPNWGDEALTVTEWGCEHDFESVQRRNCYSEVRCTKCGYHYGVDSSD